MMHPGGFHQMIMAHHEGDRHDALVRHGRDAGRDDVRRAPRRTWLGWLRVWPRQERRAPA